VQVASPEHVAQVAPPTPHEDGNVPSSHRPFALQQPAQVDGEQVFSFCPDEHADATTKINARIAANCVRMCGLPLANNDRT
jgi:hypothetical protein